MNFKSLEFPPRKFSENEPGYLPPPFYESDSSALVQDHDLTSSSVAPVLSKYEYSTNRNKNSPLKAGQDNFISEYYSNSRLHHLSMWKAELKKFTDNIHKNNQQQIINKHNILIMHVDLDSFFVSVFLKLNPEMVGKPVAVCHSLSQGTLYE